MKPKNRRDVKLPILHLEVEDADGTHVFDPNGILFAVIKQELPCKPIDGLISEISGDPAVWYRVDDLELRLSPVELIRLVERDLTPQEYRYLVGHYGMDHDWHEDFYTDEGIAIQPVRDRH